MGRKWKAQKMKCFIINAYKSTYNYSSAKLQITDYDFLETWKAQTVTKYRLKIKREWNISIHNGAIFSNDNLC